MIPYAGKPPKMRVAPNVAVISLQCENKKLSSELYQTKSEKILVERELQRARIKIEELQRAIGGINELIRDHNAEMAIDIPRYGVEEIVHATALHFGLSADTVRGNSRLREAVTARQVVYFIASRITGMNMSALGRHLGGRDHSTINAGIRRIIRTLRNDPGLAQDISLIRQRLKQNGSHVPPDTGEPLGRGASLSAGAVAEPNRQATAAASP